MLSTPALCCHETLLKTQICNKTALATSFEIFPNELYFGYIISSFSHIKSFSRIKKYDEALSNIYLVKHNMHLRVSRNESRGVITSLGAQLATQNVSILVAPNVPYDLLTTADNMCAKSLSSVQ